MSYAQEVPFLRSNVNMERNALSLLINRLQRTRQKVSITS